MEKEELTALKKELEEIQLPKRPPGAFMIYKDMMQADHGKGKGSISDYCKGLKSNYDALTESERSKYETLSQERYHSYMESFNKA